MVRQLVKGIEKALVANSCPRNMDSIGMRLEIKFYGAKGA